MAHLGKIRLTGKCAEAFYKLTSGHDYVGRDDFSGEGSPADGLISNIYVPETVDKVGETITHIIRIVEGKFPSDEGDVVEINLDLNVLRRFQMACLTAAFAISRFYDVTGRDDSAASAALLARAQFLVEAFVTETTEELKEVFDTYKDRICAEKSFDEYMEEITDEDGTNYEEE